MAEHHGEHDAEQEAELLLEHDVAEALAAEVEHVPIDLPTSHVDVVTIDDGEPIAVAVAPHALHDRTAIHVSVDAAGFGSGGSNHGDANVSAYLHHSILEGNWAAVIERCKTHPEETRYVDKRTRRTPLHEACGPRPRGSIINRVPAEVIYAILDAAGNDARGLAHKLDINGNNPLQLACRDVKLWRKDPSSSSSGSETTAQSALQVAEGQTLEQWQGVLERLVNVCPEAAFWSNKNDLTPLMDACEHEYVPPEIIQLLLSVNEQVAYFCDKTGKSALAKYGEAGGKSLAVARLLLDACPESLSYQDSDGRTPLHRPAFELNVNLVESMLLRDESVASIADQRGLLPLHRACQSMRDDNEDGTVSKIEVTRLLLDAYPEGCMKSNDRGMAPIHFASARNPNLEIIQSICETKPECVVLQDNMGWTALHHMCKTNCEEAMLYFLGANPSLAKIKTRKDDTALHLLAANTNCSALVAQLLVEEYPDAVLARNDYGFTPLHVACREAGASADFIRILYEADPNVLVVRTNAEELPIHLICQRSQVSPNVLRFCLEKMPPDFDVALSQSGNNPLHEACLRRLPLELIEMISEQKPGWVTAKNLHGQTPLHLICKVSRGVVDMSVIQTLVRIGGAQQIDDGDEYSHTPFLSSLRQDASLELIAFLLKACPEAINGVHSYFVGCQKYFGTALEIAVNRDVPTDVLSVVARAGDVSVITSPNENGIAPIQTIMYKCHDFRNVEHAFEYEERLHRAFLLVTVALGRNVDTELWNYDGVSTSVSLIDLLSFRRKFGSEFVVGGLIWFLMDTTLTSPLDPDGNTPLHIEAAVSRRPSRGEIKLRPFGVEARTKNHLRDVLTSLIEAYPTNITTSNNAGELPFDVIIKSDRGWESGIAILAERYPQALTAWLERQEFSELLLPALLQKVTQHCGIATTLQLLQNMPKFADYHK